MICPNCKEEKWAGYGDGKWNIGDGLKCLNCDFKVDEYLPSQDKKVVFHKDIEWFKEFSAPIMENMQRMHYTNVNSTIPYFGPMMYLLVRQFGCEQVLEIGHAEGYTSFYLAHGVKDNATRFGMAGNRYYGIDIVQTDSTREKLETEGLPVIVQKIDSMTLTPETFKDVRFDMIFQDGNHDTEHVLYEFDTMWPQLKGMGDGYWIAHDALGPAEEGCRKLIEKINDEKLNVEWIRLGGLYGLMIIRKLDGLNPDKRFWND